MKKAIRYGAISSYMNMARYFKEMANKGYMIAYISTSEHFFDEIKPKDLDFKVIVFNEDETSIYGDRENYIKEMKKKGWKFVLKNDKIIVFCRKPGQDVMSSVDYNKQYEMVKSVWNKNRTRNILTIIIGLILYGIRMYDFEFPIVYFNNDFMKIFMPLIAFLVLLPVLGKTPYWLYRNRRNIRNGKKLYHRKKSTDRFLDLYMYIGIPIILIAKWLLILGIKDDKTTAVMFLVFALPWIAFVRFYYSNFFISIESKFIKCVICFVAFATWFFSVLAVGFYIAMVKSGSI